MCGAMPLFFQLLFYRRSIQLAVCVHGRQDTCLPNLTADIVGARKQYGQNLRMIT
jgi:hypothetical protein